MNYIQQQKIEINKKSTGLAFALWLFLGGFGLHRFYLGLKRSAIIIAIINIIGLMCLLYSLADASQATIEILQQQDIHQSNSFSYGMSLILIPLYLWLLIDAFRLSGWTKKYNLKVIEKFSN
jgi:hypothetical protein